jgi:hypothetical protein
MTQLDLLLGQAQNAMAVNMNCAQSNEEKQIVHQAYDEMILLLQTPNATGSDGSSVTAGIDSATIELLRMTRRLESSKPSPITAPGAAACAATAGAPIGGSLTIGTQSKTDLRRD